MNFLYLSTLFSKLIPNYNFFIISFMFLSPSPSPYTSTSVFFSFDSFET